jgi:hypothetical protein
MHIALCHRQKCSYVKSMNTDKKIADIYRSDRQTETEREGERERERESH